MKKIPEFLFLLSCVFTSTIPIYAQWVQATSPAPGQIQCITISGIDLFEGNGQGQVFHSTNDGDTWTEVTNNLHNHALFINDLAYDGTNLFAIDGDGGGIFLSTNKGSDWTAINNGLTDPWIENVIISGTKLYAGSIYGEVFVSTNSGSIWSMIGSAFCNSRVLSIAVSGSYIIASTQSNGVFRSVIGDTSWIAINSGLPSGALVTNLAVSGSNLLAAVYGDGGGVFLSTDNGTSWQKRSGGTTTNDLKSVCFTDAKTGTAVGGNGTILRTTVGGASWISQLSGTTNMLSGVCCINANTGTVVGGNGTILRTTDGGANWTSQLSGTTNALYGVSFINANTGTVVGDYGTILHTTNGGASWTSQSSGTTTNLNSVSFTDTIRGTAVGGSGTILRTTDGGKSWISQSSRTTTYLTSVSFTDSITGTAVGGNGTILRTTDGGKSWTSQTCGTSQGLYGVSFANTNTGTVVGLSGSIFHTTDGGSHWTNQSGTLYDLFSVSFSSAETGMAVGRNGKILWTINGGIDWTLASPGLTSNGAYSLTYFPAEDGSGNTDLFAGTLDNKGIFLSTDNGASWQSVGLAIQFNGIEELKVGNSKLFALTVGQQIWRRPLSEIITSANEVFEPGLPNKLLLRQNFPNPFNASTTISWKLPEKAHVVLKVYDFTGCEVKTLVNEVQAKGEHLVKFDAKALPAGVYFYQFRADGKAETKKMIIK